MTPFLDRIFHFLIKNGQKMAPFFDTFLLIVLKFDFLRKKRQKMTYFWQARFNGLRPYMLHCATLSAV